MRSKAGELPLLFHVEGFHRVESLSLDLVSVATEALEFPIHSVYYSGNRRWSQDCSVVGTSLPQ